MTSRGYGSGSEQFRKTAEERTDLTESVSGRSTPIEEEWEALNILYEAFPENFPEPYRFEEDERAIYMELFDLDTKLEYATMEGYRPEKAESLYREVEKIVYNAHTAEHLVPHGDLIGNVWINTNGEPVIFDPRGIPQDDKEEQRWIEEDRWQLEWISDSIDVDCKLI